MYEWKYAAYTLIMTSQIQNVLFFFCFFYSLGTMDGTLETCAVDLAVSSYDMSNTRRRHVTLPIPSTRPSASDIALKWKKADHAKGRFASVPLKKTISAFFLFVLLKWKTCLVHFGRTLQLRPYVSEVHSSYKLGRDMQLDELIPRLKADKAKTSAEPSFLLYF